ncbi:MAG: hypothetical protein GY934_24515 [Gammaproteobacteria bacterium]|nr:hypothetical protein [Gammaproteobacteria bacterium]
MFKSKLIFIVAGLVLLITSTAYSSMSSANFSITSSVLSGGSGSMTSTNFNMTSTFGQPSPIGPVSSSSFKLNSGFWHNLFSIAIGDVNGDGIVDLQDVILTLQVLTGMSPAEIQLKADANGDGEIGLAEAINAIRQAAGL